MNEWLPYLQMLGMGAILVMQFKNSSDLGKFGQLVKGLVGQKECDARHMAEQAKCADKHAGLQRERETDAKDCDTRHADLQREREADRVALARLEAARPTPPRPAGGGQ